jgi:hypothetical protein
MKSTLTGALLLVVMLALIAMPVSAQKTKLDFTVGGDILYPVGGDFSDAFGLGYGGTVQWQYNLAPQAALGVTAGYFRWGGKDIASLGGVTGPDFSGIPLRALGKYYFSPPGRERIYALAELGVFIGSTGDVTYTPPVPGATPIMFEGGSSTDFNYVIGLGVDFPVSDDGGTKLDLNLRWDAIASDASANNIALRIAITFGIGA